MTEEYSEIAVLNAHDFSSEGTRLSAGDDLNDCTEYGKYTSTSASVSASLVNSPIGGAGFTMYVLFSGNGSIKYQLALVSDGRMYSRTYNNGWGDWMQFTRG